MEILDAHAHLSDESFRRDLQEVLDRAASRGVRRILSVSETLSDATAILALAERHRMIKPCAGLHPAHADREEADRMIGFIRRNRERIVAIGEVGLDYWLAKDHEARELQAEIFAAHIRLARELDLTLNVHSRSAGRHAIAMLQEHGAERVLMHAFDGKASAAMVGVEAGYYFSIPPSVIRSPQKQKLVRRLPLERLILESDAPVLGPRKEQRNEPQNVRIALEAIADIKGLPVAQVARATTQNAGCLFPEAFEH